jgi:hypothetical protein
VSEDAFIRELEALGIDEVKARLLANQYAKGVSPNHEKAQDWVNRKEIERQRRQEELAAAQAVQAANAADRAATAAQEQAKEARRANWIAGSALVVALAALLVAIFR